MKHILALEQNLTTHHHSISLQRAEFLPQRAHTDECSTPLCFEEHFQAPVSQTLNVLMCNKSVITNTLWFSHWGKFLESRKNYLQPRKVRVTGWELQNLPGLFLFLGFGSVLETSCHHNLKFLQPPTDGIIHTGSAFQTSKLDGF